MVFCIAPLGTKCAFTAASKNACGHNTNTNSYLAQCNINKDVYIMFLCEKGMNACRASFSICCDPCVWGVQMEYCVQLCPPANGASSLARQGWGSPFVQHLPGLARHLSGPKVQRLLSLLPVCLPTSGCAQLGNPALTLAGEEGRARL